MPPRRRRRSGRVDARGIDRGVGGALGMTIGDALTHNQVNQKDAGEPKG